MSYSAISVSLKWKRQKMPRERTERNISETRSQQANNNGEANHFKNNPEKTEKPLVCHQWRTEGGVLGVQTPLEIPKF
jgi:hypothetical protein